MADTLALVQRAQALLETLRDEHQKPADRQAVVKELGKVLDQIGRDVVGIVDVRDAKAGRKRRDRFSLPW